MTPERPLLIVSLPGRSPESVRREAERARSAGADLGEVRLDRWTPEDRERVGELFPSALPLLLTLRSRLEGGEGPDDPRERADALRSASRAPFQWVDLEEARDLSLADELREDERRRLVFSAHEAKCLTSAELVERLRRPLPSHVVRKLVMPARVGEVTDEIWPTLQALDPGPFAVLTTGPSGPWLRVEAARLRSPFTFAALPSNSREDTAPVETSQVPVDRLRWYFEAEGHGPLFAVVGHPIGHSQSPYLHSRWMRTEGRRGAYIPLDIVSESEFVECLEPLAEAGFRGLNVTHPWKSVALASASSVRRGAERSGAANCLSFQDGEIEAENTDLAAMVRRLEELRASDAWAGDEVLVVGSGGAAAASLAAAEACGARCGILSRDPAKAEALAARFGAEVRDPTAPRQSAFVIHATDVGRGTGRSLEVPMADFLAPRGYVLDWVYAPDEPLVRAIAERAAARYEDGWRLLVYQAMSTFGIWWGAEPTPEEVARTIEEGPCAA